MRHPGDDVIERRLRAAKPPRAAVDPGAVHTDLLRRIAEQPGAPVARRRGRRLALPAAAAGIVAVAALAVAAGLPGLGGPDGARAAIARTLHWFDPPTGTILHVRSEMTSRSPGAAVSTLTQESWQSVDHPGRERRAEQGIESDAAGDLYDPATNTRYVYVPPSKDVLRRRLAAAFAAKIAGARSSGASAAIIAQLRRDRDAALQRLDEGKPLGDPGNAAARVGDALVNQMRDLLRSGDAQVGDETVHDGVGAFPITFSPGGARWTMWARADDGRPLELRIDGDGPIQLGSPGLETVRWPTYEVVPGDQGARLLTIAGAHPDARVVRDAEAYALAERRLFPQG